MVVTHGTRARTAARRMIAPSARVLRPLACWWAGGPSSTWSRSRGLPLRQPLTARPRARGPRHGTAAQDPLNGGLTRSRRSDCVDDTSPGREDVMHTEEDLVRGHRLLTALVAALA